MKVAYASLFDGRAVDSAVDDFAVQLARLESLAGEDAIRLDTECELGEGAGEDGSGAGEDGSGAGEDGSGAGPHGRSGGISRLLPSTFRRRWLAGVGRTRGRS